MRSSVATTRPYSTTSSPPPVGHAPSHVGWPPQGASDAYPFTRRCGSPTARILLVTVVPLLLLLAGVAVALAVQPSNETDDWPVFLGDYDRTGVADQGPIGRPVVRWQFQAAGSMIRNVAIVGDLVYALSDDGLLHALSRQDGTERWTYPAAGSDVSVAEGTLLIADDSGAITGWMQ